MTSVFPPIPKFIFTVFEPLSLRVLPETDALPLVLIENRIVGFVGTIVDPEWFISEQIAFSPPEKLSKNAIVVALQLGNIYLLMALVGPPLFRLSQIAYPLEDWHCGVVYNYRTESCQELRDCITAW
jgi:hypothetical protein